MKQIKKDYITKSIEDIIKMIEDFKKKHKLSDFAKIDLELILSKLNKLK